MIDMLSFLRERYPHVFDRTKYTIIEISEPLAKRQRERVERMEREDPAWKGKVRVENVDWFEWEGGNRESCYFVALEVFVSPPDRWPCLRGSAPGLIVLCRRTTLRTT
jgi:hypothetical protein